MRLWDAWTRLCRRREHPVTLALIRIGLAVILLLDLLYAGYLGLPGTWWVDQRFGGLLPLEGIASPPHIARWLTMTPAAAWAAWGTLIVSISLFGSGILTRFSGLTAFLVYGQLAQLTPPADRAIDRLIRIVILILLFSRSADTLSVSARRRTGRWLGDGTPAPAWPRYLIVLQLLFVYWGAGVAKTSVYWFPWGDYSALYIVLQDPVYSYWDQAVLAHPLLYRLTQVGTATTHMWEVLAPVLGLTLYYRSTRTRSGRLRALFNRLSFRTWFVLIGFIFHVMLTCSLRLGIFPLAMLACYPAFFHPEELAAWRQRLRRARSR